MIFLPEARDFKELREILATALRRLEEQIPADRWNFLNRQLRNVGDPAKATDAVNLQTLERRLGSPSSGGGARPVGPAFGDLGGQYPAPTVTGLQTVPISDTAPTDGQVLTYNDTDGVWEPSTAGSSNTALTANASASLNLDGTMTDIPGATVTLDKTGTWLVSGSAGMYQDQQDGYVQVQLVVNGVAQSGIIISRIFFVSGGADFLTTGSRVWIITGSNTNVVKLQANISAVGGGNSQITQDGTSITAVFLHS